MVGDKYEIKADEDLVTPERASKGDLEMSYNSNDKIQRAIPATLTITKELIRRGVFPYHYEIYGVTFLELQQAFLTPWATRSSAVLLEQWGIGVSESRSSGIYQNICRRVGNRRKAMVNFIMEEPKEKEDKQHHEVYRDCFDVLIQVMDEERERALLEIKT